MNQTAHTVKLAKPYTGRLLPRVAKSGGFSILETLVACAIVVSAFGGMMHASVVFNRHAAFSRMQTNARAVVQRNIDQALSEKFTLQSNPAILAITGTTGAVWDDDGGGDSKVAVVQNGTGTVTSYGTLTRTVTSITNTNGADIRSIRFALSYAYRGKTYSYAANTVRAID